MSKKLIAVAAAAALALTGLVAIPASATGTYTVAITGGSDVTGGSTAALALVHYSLEENELVANTSVKFVVSATNGRTTDSVTVTPAAGVRVLEDITDDAGDPKATTAGQATALTLKMVSGKATFYAYTTSTTAGTVTVSSNNNSTTYYVKSLAGSAYNVAATFPTSLVKDGSAKVYAKVTDVFGNEIDNARSADTLRDGTTSVFVADGVDDSTIMQLSAVGATPTESAWRYSATKKAWEGSVDDIEAGSVALRVTLVAAADLEVGFAAPKASAFAVISSASLEAQITALTAQVAALKDDYNKLAARWNKRVADKKAPKKAVATK
jgi:hypothetical protein